MKMMKRLLKQRVKKAKEMLHELQLANMDKKYNAIRNTKSIKGMSKDIEKEQKYKEFIRKWG